MKNLYDQLPLPVLAQFLYHIQDNIEKGIHSNTMHAEVKLIQKAMMKKGSSLTELRFYYLHKTKN